MSLESRFWISGSQLSEGYISCRFSLRQQNVVVHYFIRGTNQGETEEGDFIVSFTELFNKVPHQLFDWELRTPKELYAEFQRVMSERRISLTELFMRLGIFEYEEI